ncbi:MAG TPA: UDP-N-acetylmuramoyl-tripeptide--D-alanyl-D-alanine ligase [Methylophaga aminisulfidivorans]|uniref:UDP-N-acetylmuramoyl-tripeptide--D-alanyl-D- alanine ligase n=1 Tax=Methylophaga TaxID=40222 RepID=UPI001771BA44|nr:MULTISPECIES: UDP-N-acetylmuramoyl-tripeptide--D-alanyl-D-alanine ligase [Methylophaga]HIC45148.1 UDP-N-acetylmuramoyl-tripeptide--D-alanyl-D-alanine ligase [Methylophaga sp.]HIM40964.1 UDP-N-acetylmuramoyl-tripeptide--D-alanyl-D-alanine ligase [Methylophaga aminisulfidivorans]
MGLQLPLKQIAEIVSADMPIVDVTVTGAVIDSRKVTPGDLFIAFKGEHVDGHEYVAKARESGAVAALVSEYQDDELPQIKVDDVRVAFGQIARAWLAECKAKVVAITGSNGKTSLKEMVKAILAEVGTVSATQGNLNNDLGVPLTVCRIDKNDDYAVIEMGTNHPGEIAYLMSIVSPDVSVINNIAAAHLEGLGSEEGIAREKGSIYEGLKQNGVAVVNADMPYDSIWQPLIADRKTIRFALQNNADIYAEYIQPEPASSHFLVHIDGVNHHMTLPLPGLHNVSNALAAIAVSVALDIPVDAVVRGLNKIQAVPHRLQMRKGLSDSRLIDDTYNANPGSYLRALETLAGFQEPRWLVLGDFGELGEEADAIHQTMGLQAKSAGVTTLFTVGEKSQLAAAAFGDNAIHFEDVQTLQQLLQNTLTADVTCLIKGSRFMQLDKLADALVAEAQ